MTVTVLTKESLQELKYEILDTIKATAEGKNGEPKKWLRTRELQELIDLSAGTLKNLRDAGIIKYWKDVQFVYYDWEYIEELLEGPHRKTKKTKK